MENSFEMTDRVDPDETTVFILDLRYLQRGVCSIIQGKENLIIVCCEVELM